MKYAHWCRRSGHDWLKTNKFSALPIRVIRKNADDLNYGKFPGKSLNDDRLSGTYCTKFKDEF
jgi:hypothetical protein